MQSVNMLKDQESNIISWYSSVITLLQLTEKNGVTKFDIAFEYYNTKHNAS